MTDKSGILYQNLGNAKIYNSFLSLLSFTNLSFYQEKFTFIKELYPKSIEICKKCENFNGISTGLKWLIGAPDANDAEFYSAAIKTLQNKNPETLTLMRAQIHMMNSAS
jgi:hypothetical protein